MANKATTGQVGNIGGVSPTEASTPETNAKTEELSPKGAWVNKNGAEAVNPDKRSWRETFRIVPGGSPPLSESESEDTSP